MSSYRYEVQRADLRCRLLPNVSKGKVRQENTLIAELFELYPDQKFWKGLTPTFPLETFADLFTRQGKAFLKRAWAHFHFEPPVAPVRFELGEKVGEDRFIPATKRTLREFLNG